MAFNSGGGSGGSISGSNDVALSSPVRNDVLSFDNSNDKWINTPLNNKLNSSVLSNLEGIASHSGSSWPARPVGFARIRWVGGTVRPGAMAVGDVWEHQA